MRTEHIIIFCKPWKTIPKSRKTRFATFYNGRARSIRLTNRADGNIKSVKPN